MIETTRQSWHGGTRQSWHKAFQSLQWSFPYILHSYGATVLPRFHRAIECQARMLRTYQPLSSKRRSCALLTGKRLDRSRAGSFTVEPIFLSAVCWLVLMGQYLRGCSTWNGNNQNTPNSTLAILVSRGQLEDEDVVSITRVGWLLLSYWSISKAGNEKCRCSCGSTGTERLRRAAFQETTRSLASGLVRLPPN